jgi:pyrimidine-nucleoside phosphorylase/thymidine phosphorylase
MLAQELIARKRDGAELTSEELREFLTEYGSGRVPDYQMSAFLMAVLLKGMSAAELGTLTRTIIDSGRRLDFRTDGGPPAVDKHSTGGVGDKVSLVLAPLLAEYGVRVPMMSGRGLGHTGGTIDKLESIPGFRTDLDLEEFHHVLADVGCAMIRQTAAIAPLDGSLYALRDVTATVPSIPLIAASIISKKVAEGIEALVLDVKYGSGAFMRDPDQSVLLAETLVGLAESEGVRATALLTAMEQPLGRTVGNALEVREAVECLDGGGPADLREVTLALAVESVAVAIPQGDKTEVRGQLEAMLDDGRALARFARLVERQGGDPEVISRPEILPKAPLRRTWEAPADGFVRRADAYEIGVASVELGAGRRKLEDDVDPAVGIQLFVRRGEAARRGQPVAEVHARSEEAAERAVARLRGAYEFGEIPPEDVPLVWRRVPGETGRGR